MFETKLETVAVKHNLLSCICTEVKLLYLLKCFAVVYVSQCVIVRVIYNFGIKYPHNSVLGLDPGSGVLALAAKLLTA